MSISDSFSQTWELTKSVAGSVGDTVGSVSRFFIEAAADPGWNAAYQVLGGWTAAIFAYRITDRLVSAKFEKDTFSHKMARFSAKTTIPMASGFLTAVAIGAFKGNPDPVNTVQQGLAFGAAAFAAYKVSDFGLEHFFPEKRKSPAKNADEKGKYQKKDAAGAKGGYLLNHWASKATLKTGAAILAGTLAASIVGNNDQNNDVPHSPGNYYFITDDALGHNHSYNEALIKPYAPAAIAGISSQQAPA